MISPRLTVACAIALAATTAVPAAASAADSFVWATFGTERNPIVKCGPMRIAKRISEITGRKQEIHLGQSAFANPRKLYPEVARGIVDFTWGILSYSPGRFPMTEIVSLPFVARNNKVAARAVNKLAPKYLAKEFRAVKLLAIAMPGLYQFHLKKPVPNIITGLKGLRLRVVGAGLTDLIDKLGADVVALPMPASYENLQKGVVDGILGPDAALVAFKLYEVTTYHIQANIAGSLVFAALSKKFWRSLTKAQRAQIEKELAGPDAGVRYTSCWNKPDAIGMKLGKKNGGTVRTLTAAERAAAEKMAAPIIDGYLAKLEKRGMPARAFHKALVAEIAKGMK